MALTRKYLAAMNIDADKVEQIIEAHTETVDALKKERDQYKADAEKLAEVTRERDELKTAAEKADKDPYKVKYEAVKEDFESFKADLKKKETAAAKTDAVRTLLKNIGISEKRIDAVLKVTDINAINLDENGKIEGEGELKKSLKAEWADFIVTTEKKGAEVPTPPNNNGNTYMTRDEIRKIKDTTERQKEWVKYIEAQKGN